MVMPCSSSDTVWSAVFFREKPYLVLQGKAFLSQQTPHAKPQHLAAQSDQMKRTPLLLWTLVLLLLSAGALQAERVQVSFYTTQIELEYDKSILPRQALFINNTAITRFYGQLEQSNYRLLLGQLLQQKASLQLNDWLYFQLCQKATAQIYQTRSRQEQLVFIWFLLNQSGLDARLTYRDEQVFLCAYTTESVFAVPLIQLDQKTFVNISEIGGASYDEGPVYLLDFTPNPKGRSFSFSLQVMPLLPARIEQKQLHFRFLDSLYSWSVQIDQAYIQLMSNYPFVEETEYLRAPMSTAMQNALLPKIRASIEGMDQQLSVQFLLNFTRSAFAYKEDKAFFGRSKPMIPEEVLNYPYSDCEDRVALFYALMKSTLGLPMILIAYPDHISVGVYLPHVPGETIHYQGKKYLFCDPTGPENSLQIGQIPADLKRVSYEIIHVFPEN